ncbi:hypothetical protein BFP97_06605 [Roseivirga sp. 4D4]|uniref:hypothetical protein n=1 Tax=Roseivirga sp. 4D4 TaxID=1889784 RepID=UPI0008531F40|nr:hypothetical protein [Roseivirga sp. 4D4]OEK01200.1 hypothetical protein BFP97_06605 [Roseivirga sp. 4D4]
MKSSNTSLKVILTLVMLSFAVSCGSGNSESSNSDRPFNPVGKWEYKVTTDVSYGEIDISKSGNTFKAVMTTEVFGTLDLMNLKIEENVLTADLDVGGTPAIIKCEFDGDDFTGAVVAGETTFPMVGQRAGD